MPPAPIDSTESAQTECLEVVDSPAERYVYWAQLRFCLRLFRR